MIADFPSPARPPDDRAYSLAYDELRILARQFMRRERRDHTLQPTALVHEAYLKLCAGPRAAAWVDRQHFLACAARAMRQILVDHARHRGAAKRRVLPAAITLASFVPEEAIPYDDIVAVDQALQRLSAVEPNGARQVRLIEYVWLAGMDMTEAATELGISRSQAYRDWRWARTWLKLEIGRA